MDRELEQRVTHDHQDSAEVAEVVRTNRRHFLGRSALAAGGLALFGAACSSDGDGNVAAAASSGSSGGGGGDGASSSAGSGTSLFDRIRDGDTVKVGADLTFPPLQFRDDEGNPAGYTVELAIEMLSDLNPDAELEFVEVAFGELFGSLAAGRFDISAIGATILPTRAQQVLFATEPLFIENNIILRNADSPVTSADQINAADVKLAVLAGSAQEASARRLFPDATLVSLEQQPAVQEAATGRADAVLLGEFNIGGALEANSSLEVLSGPPLFADINTWFMAQGDFRMQSYVDNWLRYNIIRGRLSTFWDERVGDAARSSGVPSFGVYSPYLAAAEVLGDTGS